MARVLSRATRRDDGGMAIVAVVILVSVIFVIGGLWLSIGTHQTEASARERSREQAFAVAEAGINDAMSRLAVNGAYGGTGAATYQSVGTGGHVMGYFTTVVSPVTGDPDARYITARGWAPSPTAPNASRVQLEHQVRLRPTGGFQYALFAAPGGVNGANHMTVTGDVYAADDFVLANNANVFGSIYSRGDVTTRNNSTISEDVRAVGNVSLDNSQTRVNGNVWAGEDNVVSNISGTGSILGNATASGTISGVTVLNPGVTTPGSRWPPTVPTQTLPHFSWDASAYTPAGVVYSDTDAFKTFWRDKATNNRGFSGHYYIADAGTLVLDRSTKLIGDTTIVSEGPIQLTRDFVGCVPPSPPTGTITTCSPPNNPYQLTIVSLSTSTTALSMTNNVTIPASVRLLMFAEYGGVEFSQLKHFTGTVYAKNITLDQQFTLSWVDMPVCTGPNTPAGCIPGFDFSGAAATHWIVESQAFKHVPFTNP